MATKPQAKTEELICHVCVRETDHGVLREVVEHWDTPAGPNDEYLVSGIERYQIVRCNGCKNVAYVHKSWFSEDWPLDPPRMTRFPPVPSRVRPTWMTEVPKEVPDVLVNLLAEVYRSLEANASTVAAMGARAVFEHMMISQVGDHGCFEDNVDAFIKAGFVGEKYRPLIFQVLEVGHAAIHRGHEVSRKDMSVILGLLESLADIIYIHPQSIGSLDSPPPRPPRKKKGDKGKAASASIEKSEGKG